MPIPEEIERVALLGWHVYPASPWSRAACFKGASRLATADLNVLARWAHEFPSCNWRVVCRPSGIWGLDVDVPPMHVADGIANLTNLVKTHGPIPPRPQLRSGGGGVALFFAYNGEQIIGEGGQPAPGIDPRRGQQSQTIPPSRHIVTKRPYRWLTPPWDVAPPPAPAWLLRLLAPPPAPSWTRAPIATNDQAREKLYRATSVISAALPGDRNNTLNRRAYQVGRYVAAGLVAPQEAVEALYGAARMAGIDHAEAKATIKSGIESGMRRGG